MAYRVQIEYKIYGPREHEIIKAHLVVVEHDQYLSKDVLGSVCNGYSDKMVLGAFFTREDANAAVDVVLEKAREKVAELRAVLRTTPDIDEVTL